MDSKTKLRRRLVSLLGVLGVVGIALVVGACGSSNSSSGSSTSSGGGSSSGSGSDAQAAATAVINKGKQIPKFILKAPPVDLSKVKGKTVFNIPEASTIPYVVATDQQMKQVAQAHGVKFIEYANQGNPTQWAQGINQAIQQHADVIVMQAGNNPQTVIPQLRRAKAAGIPVVVSHLYENGEKPPANVRSLISAYVTVPFNESGQLSVDYAISQDGCDGVNHTIIITANEVYPSTGIVNAMKQQLQKRCPGSSAKVINVPVPDWGTKIAPETQSAIASDPSIKWVLPIYDSMSLGVVSGIRQAGKTGQVRVASYNGTPDLLKLIQDGTPMAADMGEDINWLGYANMDQVFRVLAGGPIIKDGFEGTPLRVFDKSNVDETGTPPTPNKGYGNAYVTGYGKLWKNG